MKCKVLIKINVREGKREHRDGQKKVNYDKASVNLRGGLWGKN